LAEGEKNRGTTSVCPFLTAAGLRGCGGQRKPRHPSAITCAHGTAYLLARSACSSGWYSPCSTSTGSLHRPEFLWDTVLRVLVPFNAFYAI